MEDRAGSSTEVDSSFAGRGLCNCSPYRESEDSNSGVANTWASVNVSSQKSVGDFVWVSLD